MNTLTLKIPDVIKEKLQTYSKQRGLSKSEIVRDALDDYFGRDELGKQGTFYDLAKDLCGSVEGASDLSTNKEYLSGYGQ